MDLRALFHRKGVLKCRALPCAVISVGNITAGGTGKTPMTICLAKLLNSLGHKVVVISRGYGGTKEAGGGIVSSGQKIAMDAKAAGDEPYMMAVKLHGVPVLVGKGRFKLGTLAVKRFDAKIVILDDGFQHIQLKRNLDILLLDAKQPFGNGYLLPRGMLRESLRQLERADAFVLTRSQSILPGSGQHVIDTLKGKGPVFQCAHIPEVVTRIPGDNWLPGNLREIKDRLDPAFLKGRKVFAFSGIAKNENFLEMIQRLGCKIRGFLAFSDHHKYTDEDFKTILQAAKRAGVDALLTTEKDYVRIAGKTKWPLDLLVLGVRISFGDQEASFITFVKDRLGLESPVAIE